MPRYILLWKWNVSIVACYYLKQNYNQMAEAMNEPAALNPTEALSQTQMQRSIVCPLYNELQPTVSRVFLQPSLILLLRLHVLLKVISLVYLTDACGQNDCGGSPHSPQQATRKTKACISPTHYNNPLTYLHTLEDIQPSSSERHLAPH